MTNEEKAKEVVRKIKDTQFGEALFTFSYPMGDRCIDYMREYCLEMAEWKDRQFDEKIAHFFHLVQDGISFERAYKQVTGKDWQSETPEAPEKEAAKPAWVKFIEKFEEGSDEWRIAHKLLQKYNQKGYDIHRNIPGELLEELKNVYNIQVKI